MARVCRATLVIYRFVIAYRLVSDLDTGVDPVAHFSEHGFNL